MLTTLATIADIPGVLALQEKYLFKNLSPEERKSGFVTTPFTVKQIEDILEENGLFVAKNESEEVIAYIFAASWRYFEQWEIFKHTVSLFPKIHFRGQEIKVENSFQYGPVCIDEKYRGQVVLNKLFEEMRLEFVKRYPISITFINQINKISKPAHTRKLAWEIIDTFAFNDNNYYTLAFDMHESVLNK